MGLGRRNLMVYGLLIAAWALVVVWQVQEHVRVREAARADLRNRSKDIAKTISAFIRGLRFRGTVSQERIEPVLTELVNARATELTRSSELLSIVLVNAAGDPVASAGGPLELSHDKILQEGERWGRSSVTLINPVDLGASLISEGATNPTVVLPARHELTNTLTLREPGRPMPRREPWPAGEHPPGPPPGGPPPPEGLGSIPDSMTTPPPPPPDRDGGPRDGPPRSRRPPWLRGMSEGEYHALVQKRALHGLILVMSTESLRSASARDLVLRGFICLLATVSAIGLALAWGNLAKTSDLQVRLIRASELNTHLREMNLAAAGLAHETRNPLNIIRGLAQMISKRADAPPETRQQSLDIINEADKVAAQLNEFINYSRPREVRRSVVSLGAVINEVTRALSYDLQEKSVPLQVKGEPLYIEADEQLLRQALFNLLLNAIQAVGPGGEIEIAAEKASAAEGRLEVRDNGPGVPPEKRAEIFKPYFTTRQQGAGLGLAVVQQIVLAHGWEIECLANQPQGALFRITHLKLAARPAAP
jgi:signal transduction histidine kinase